MDPKTHGKELAEKLDAELIGSIGFVAILYKESDSIKTHVLEDVE
jgi:RNA-binding protein YhbY